MKSRTLRLAFAPGVSDLFDALHEARNRTHTVTREVENQAKIRREGKVVMVQVVTEVTEALDGLLKGQIDTFNGFEQDKLLQLTKAALKSDGFTPEDYLKIFDAIILAGHGDNEAILHNLALLAVDARLFKEAYGFAMEAYENKNIFSAAAIARKALKTKSLTFRKEFEHLIEKITDMGHLHTRFYLFDQKFVGWGMFGYPFRIAYRLYLLPFTLFIVIKNVNDPRLDTLEKKRHDSKP